jgi:mediator of RNA polymerase II transcription subunit 5
MFESDATMFQLTDVRQEFLFACCLHELIPEESIERLLGEIPVQTLPPGGRYINEQLVAQCATDPERVEGLLGEIEGMDGNAGAVVGAVTEV